MDVLQWTDERGRAVRREVVRHPGAVLILPLLEDHRLLLIRNYRIAVDQTLWELPAGKLEAGEDPREAAARELEEEAGYAAGRIEPLGAFFTSPGFADELIRAYVASDLTPVGQRLEPGEQIQVQTVEAEEALRMIADGRICDGKTIACLLMWDRLHRGAAP